MSPQQNWRKSTHSASGTAQCVEAANGGASILVRDTTDRAGFVLGISLAAWTAFTASLRA